LRLSDLALPVDLNRSIIYRGDCRLCQRYIRLCIPSGAICGNGSIDSQCGLGALRCQHSPLLITEESVDPRQGGFALQRCDLHAAVLMLALNLSVQSTAARIQLFGAGNFLGNGDATHRHGVSRQSPAIVPAYWKVINPGAEHRVGPFSSALAHCLNGANRMTLRLQLRRIFDCNLQGLGEFDAVRGGARFG